MDKSIDTILNTSGKSRILRIFVSQGSLFRGSGRHIAKLSGMSAPAAHAALKELSDQNILKMEVTGRQHIYSLNTENRITRELLIPMFQKELSFSLEMENHLARHTRTSNVYIIAGSNGSGKTTFAKRFLPGYTGCKEFINSDLIAQGLSPFSPEGAAMKAGRLVLERIDTLAKQNLDFGFETTLSGKLYMSRLKHLRQKGYLLHLFFLWIPSPELAVARIKERVAEGGHNVPKNDVKRRFSRGLHNFFMNYRHMLDSWMLLDNSSIIPSLVAKEKGKELVIVNEALYKEIIKTTS